MGCATSSAKQPVKVVSKDSDDSASTTLLSEGGHHSPRHSPSKVYDESLQSTPCKDYEKMELEMDELDTIVKPSDLSTDDTDARSLAPEPSESPQAREEVRGPSIKAYLAKFGGAGVAGPPRPPLTQTGFSFFGSFTGIALLGLVHTYLLPAMPSTHLVMMIGSFGAMAVLVFGQPKAPLAQPKNAILGNTIGGIVGVTVVKVMALAGVGHMLWLIGALAVSLTIVLQELTTSVHPPGGATSLIFAITPPLQVLGYAYVLCPAFLGAVILVAVGLITNNLSESRQYPQGWW
mmetsp:Transcript_2668/g.5635  ORF Transcript_2668/g.5635 Transcript_2668/m.5635 type:complete len:291 (+) Transcript_2668:53-925(+)